MRLLTIAITTLAAAILLGACTGTESSSQNSNKPATVASTPYPDGARRVTIQELEAMMKEGKVLVVDVRNQDTFDEGHIPGAKLIPSGEILNHIQELPRDKLIVTYCG